MATSLANASRLEWVGASDNSVPVVVDYAEGTSETFKRGDLVIYDRSEDGVVVVTQGDGGVYGDTNNDEVANNVNCLGVAQRDASGTAGTLIPVLLPRPNVDRFAAIVFDTDNTTVTAPVTDDIGTLVDFIKGDANNNSATGVLRGTAGLWAKIVDISRQDTQFRGGTVGGDPTYSAGDRVVVVLQSGVSSDGSQA